MIQKRAFDQSELTISLEVISIASNSNPNLHFNTVESSIRSLTTKQQRNIEMTARCRFEKSDVCFVASTIIAYLPSGHLCEIYVRGEIPETCRWEDELVVNENINDFNCLFQNVEIFWQRTFLTKICHNIYEHS